MTLALGAEAHIAVFDRWLFLLRLRHIRKTKPSKHQAPSFTNDRCSKTVALSHCIECSDPIQRFVNADYSRTVVRLFHLELRSITQSTHIYRALISFALGNAMAQHICCTHGNAQHQMDVSMTLHHCIWMHRIWMHHKQHTPRGTLYERLFDREYSM